MRTKSDAFVAGSGLVTGLTGNAAIQVDTTNSYDHANMIITIATVVVIFLLLGLIFRSLIIAILPIVVIGLVHSAVSGIAAWLAEAFKFQVGNSLTSLLVVVLFGIGTDYIVPTVPIPRTTAKGCPPQGGPDLLLLGGREGRGLLGVDRCRSVCCTIPGEARVFEHPCSRSHRGGGDHACDRPDAGPGDLEPPRGSRVLAWRLGKLPQEAARQGGAFRGSCATRPSWRERSASFWWVGVRYVGLVTDVQHAVRTPRQHGIAGGLQHARSRFPAGRARPPRSMSSEPLRSARAHCPRSRPT